MIKRRNPKVRALRTRLNFRDKLTVGRFVRKYPKTLFGVRHLVADLNKYLTNINDFRKDVKAKEYNKSGVEMIREKKMLVSFSSRGIPAYGCHQLSKALVVSLRQMGIPAKIGRHLPGNESFVIFRLNKEVYEMLPFSGKMRKVDKERREFYRKHLSESTGGVKNLRLRGMENYTYSDFEFDKKIKKTPPIKQI